MEAGVVGSSPISHPMKFGHRHRRYTNFIEMDMDLNAGASEGERGGVDGRASRREPVTKSHQSPHEISNCISI